MILIHLSSKEGRVECLKLWKILYPNSTLGHLKFQHEIVKELLINQAEILRKKLSIIEVLSSDIIILSDENKCKCEHLSKKDYCLACKSQLPKLKRRRSLAEMDGNRIKRRRASQTV
jgi:hypothetical protein